MAAKWAWSNSGIGSMILEKLWKTSKDHTFLRQMIVRRGKCSRLWFRVNVFFLISRDDSPFSSVFACNVADLPPPKRNMPSPKRCWSVATLLLTVNSWKAWHHRCVSKRYSIRKNKLENIYIYIYRQEKKTCFLRVYLVKRCQKKQFSLLDVPLNQSTRSTLDG